LQVTDAGCQALAADVQLVRKNGSMQLYVIGKQMVTDFMSGDEF